LLCLDNAEELITNDAKEFAAFLEKLFDGCKQLKIIVTSRKNIELEALSIQPQTIFVRQLRSILAAELFYELCERVGCGYGAVSRLDIVAFLLEDKNYPFEKIFP